MQFKEIEYSDIKDIAYLEKEIFINPWTYKMLADSYITGLFYGVIIVVDDKIIGYGGYISVIDEAEITRIAILEKYRGNGYGDKIFKMLINHCRDTGIKKINLEVRVSNYAAINLYKKYNFEIIYERKRYYEDNDENALIMQLQIQEV